MMLNSSKFALLLLCSVLMVSCAKSPVKPIYHFNLLPSYYELAEIKSHAVVFLNLTDNSSVNVGGFCDGAKDVMDKFGSEWVLKCNNSSIVNNEEVIWFDVLANILIPSDINSDLVAEIILSSNIFKDRFEYSVSTQNGWDDTDGWIVSHNLGFLIAESILNQLSESRELLSGPFYLLEDQRQAEKRRKQLPEVSNKEAAKLYANMLQGKYINKFKPSVEAYRLAVSNRYNPTHLPTFSKSPIVLDELKTDLFPMDSGDLPLNPILMNRKDIKKALSKTEKVILIQLLKPIAKRDIISQSKVDSKYVSGHREQHNPDYDTALREYHRAQNEYNRVQAKISSSSPSGGSLWWMKSVNDGAQIAVVSAVVNRAQQRLAQTPQTTSILIKKSYSYNVMEVQVSKDISYNLYIIDLATKKVLSKKFSNSEDKTFKLQYDKHSEDTGYARYDTESDVEAYEKQKLSFSVDAIVQKLVTTNSKEFKSQAYTNSLSFIKSTKAKKRKVKKSKAVNGKFSDLMESVVAIQDNGGDTIGTGFFVNKSLLLTNRHVVDGRKLISVRTKSGKKYIGKVLDTHYDLDIALIEIDGTGIPVKMYSGSSATAGEEVIAIGNPIGLEYSVTKGIISSIRKRKDKKKPLSKEYRYIQTDVAINPGNSGGPLFMGGKVVGINTSKMVDDDIEGIGFAIHYDEVVRYLNDNNVQLTKVKSKPSVKPKKKSKESSEDKAERKLARLKRMFDKGLITEDEYKKERTEVLEEF